MASASVAFGDFLPDLASTPDHLSMAKNCRALSNGYGPVGAFQAVTSTLGEAFVGGGAFIGSDGTATLLAATPTKLRKFAGSWSDEITVTTAKRWRFAQFGDNIIYANGGQLGSYDLSAGTGGVITGAPTNCIDVATVGDFVMTLTDDAQVIWSGFNNSSEWTSGTDQSDAQPLLDGGDGVALVGGQVGLIFQRNAIRRATYTGETNIWFQFDVISAEVGCMAQGSVCNVGRIVGFLSERGFQICDGESVQPIGEDKFNRWFFDTYSRADIANIWSAVDPRNSLMMWAMPGGFILIYNFITQKATVLDADVQAILTGLTNSVSIDVLDATYPDGLDSIPISLDDASLQGGNPMLLVVNSANELGALAGPALAATFQVPNIELTPGRRSRVQSLRPITDAVNATATLDARMRAGDAGGIESAATMRSNGKMPIRANGRYMNLLLGIPAGEAWTYVRGCEFEYSAGDGR